MLLSRKGQQTLKVVVITSLCWCIVDVWFLSYFSGCTTNSVSSPVFNNKGGGDAGITEFPVHSEEQDGGDPMKGQKKTEDKDGGFFNNLLPEGILTENNVYPWCCYFLFVSCHLRTKL